MLSENLTEWRWMGRGKFVRVIDGDTIVVMEDKGRNQYELSHLRFKDINTPELHPRKAGRTEEDLRDERERATAARSHLEALIGLVDTEIIWETTKLSFGRYVSWVWVAIDGRWIDKQASSLNKQMIDSGHAKYVGKDGISTD